MKILLTALAVVIAFATVAYAQPAEDEPSAEIDRIFQRFQDPENANRFASAMWTVTHDYKDYKHMDKIVNDVLGYADAIQKYKTGDKEPLRKLGGIENYKKKLGEMLTDSDQAIRAFGAVLIGITGDKAFAASLAKLLDNRPVDEDERMVYDRGRAAMALGMVGANEYKSKLAELLKSKNEYDRAGAISALADFRATEYAKEIAGLLGRPDPGVDDDPSPVYFLIETGVAKDYKPQLLKAMVDPFGRETAKAAMYALVSLDAKEHAKEIAQLLGNEFRKADAAKALALLGAVEYTGRIASLLKDKSGLVRSAAVLSLGILDAKRYAPEVAKLLNDPENYVHVYAATALMLMQAEPFYRAALPKLEMGRESGHYVTGEDQFDPIVAAKTRVVTERLIKAIEAAQRTTN